MLGDFRLRAAQDFYEVADTNLLFLHEVKQPETGLSPRISDQTGLTLWRTEKPPTSEGNTYPVQSRPSKSPNWVHFYEKPVYRPHGYFRDSRILLENLG